MRPIFVRFCFLLVVALFTKIVPPPTLASNVTDCWKAPDGFPVDFCLASSAVGTTVQDIATFVGKFPVRAPRFQNDGAITPYLNIYKHPFSQRHPQFLLYVEHKSIVQIYKLAKGYHMELATSGPAKQIPANNLLLLTLPEGTKANFTLAKDATYTKQHMANEGQTGEKVYDKVFAKKSFKYLFPSDDNIRLNKYPKLVEVFGQPDTTVTAFENSLGEPTHYEAQYWTKGQKVLACRFQNDASKEVTHVMVYNNEGTKSFFEQYPTLDRSVLNFFNTSIDFIYKHLPAENTEFTTTFDLNTQSGNQAVFHVFRHNINKYYKMATKTTFVDMKANDGLCDYIVFMPNY